MHVFIQKDASFATAVNGEITVVFQMCLPYIQEDILVSLFHRSTGVFLGSGYNVG